MRIKPYIRKEGKWYRAKCDKCEALLRNTTRTGLCWECWVPTRKGIILSYKPRFKDGIRSYRTIVEEKKGIKFCERCEHDGNKKKLIVHHIDRNRHNNNVSNLEVLCTMCHAHEHKNWEKQNHA